MTTTIRRCRSLAVLALAALAGLAGAQDYPNKPIRFIVPYPPGGGTDVIARILQEPLAAELGQPIIIENKGGAAGNVGTDVAAKAPPDGYTILFTLSSHTINPKLYDKLPFDVERDFAPITLATLVPQILVAHPSVPANNVKELIALAKANPGKLNYASVGTGSPAHIAGELLKLKTGIDMVHVPYKGGGPAVVDTIGGQVQLAFVSMPAAWQHVKAGKLKAIAVTSAAPRRGGARRADDRGDGSGLRRRLVVRRARAGEDAARRDREAQRRVREGAREPAGEGEAPRAGRRGGAGSPAEFDRADQGRAREMGARDQDGEASSRNEGPLAMAGHPLPDRRTRSSRRSSRAPAPRSERTRRGRRSASTRRSPPRAGRSSSRRATARWPSSRCATRAGQRRGQDRQEPAQDARAAARPRAARSRSA